MNSRIGESQMKNSVLQSIGLIHPWYQDMLMCQLRSVISRHKLILQRDRPPSYRLHPHHQPRPL